MSQNVKLIGRKFNIPPWLIQWAECIYKCRLKIIFFTVYALFSLYAISDFMQNSNLGDTYPYTGYERMMNGYAHRPFIYRQLVPKISNMIFDSAPASVKDSVNNFVETIKYSPRYLKVRNYMPWLERSFPDKQRHFNRLVTLLIDYFALLGYMTMLYKLAQKIFVSEPAIAYFAPIIGAFQFIAFNTPWYYIYDLPCLFLSTCFFYYLFVGRHRALIFIFVLTAFNKESSILLLIFYFIWNMKRLPLVTYIFLGSVMALTFLTIKIIVTLQFAKNGGYFLEDNFSAIYTRDLLSQSLTRFIIVPTVFFLLTFRWGEKPLFLKQSLWLTPIMYIAYIYVGNPFEYRVFFDIHAPLVLLMTHTLISATDISKSPVFRKSDI